MNSSPGENADRARDVSLDALVGGRVRLFQPKGGLRAAIDPVLLAASVPAHSGECVLEVGCGTGAAALCLAVRMPGVQVVGLDLQHDLVALARESADLNRVSDRVTFLAGDLLAPPATIEARIFDHVMANPPFARAGSGHVSPDVAKALASIEGEADLAAWVAFCARHTKAGGSITFIHRADRAGEVAELFASAGLDAIVLPLGVKRVLVRGNKPVSQDVAARAVHYLDGFALHQADGQFTSKADRILRGGEALAMERAAR